MDAVHTNFAEFLNRLDDIVMFHLAMRARSLAASISRWLACPSV